MKVLIDLTYIILGLGIVAIGVTLIWVGLFGGSISIHIHLN